MAFDAKEDAELLRKAMKGMGTDDKTLAATICRRNNEELQLVRKAFADEFKRDLVEDIKSECSGAYELALVGLVLTRAQFDARCCKDAMKGAGTDEEVLIEHLVHRTWDEMTAIEAAYLEMYGKTLVHDLEGDLSGKSQKFFVNLVKNRRTEPEITPDQLSVDCAALFHAGQGKAGTDEDVFIEKLTLLGPKYLRALNEEYGKRHGDTLQNAIEKEMGGTIGKAMTAMLQEHDDYYADLVAKAVDGAGTNESRLVRTLCSRRHRLAPIQSKFMIKYGKSFKGRVESEVGGDLLRVLVSITTNLQA